MNIKPLADRVLVKVEQLQEKTASGIIIPQTAQEKTQIGTVAAIGDEVKNLKVGQNISEDGRRRVSHPQHQGCPCCNRLSI